MSIPPSLKDLGVRPTTSGGEIKEFSESAEGIDVVIYDAAGGHWRELFNSDATNFGGSGIGNMGKVTATRNQWGSFEHSAIITVPPLGVLFFYKPAN